MVNEELIHSYKVETSLLERQNRVNRPLLALILLLVIAAALRLVGLGGSFWYDEVNVADQAIGTYTFSERLEIIEKWRGAAPLYALFLSQWSKLGTSEYVLRLSVVIFAILGLAATYSLGTIVFDRRVGLIAVLLLTFSPSHLKYSQELRFYALLGLLVVLSVISLLIFLERPNRTRWAFVVVVHALCFYSGYFTAFVILLESAYVTVLLMLCVLRRDWRHLISFKQYAAITLGLTLSVLLFLPWFIFGALKEPTGGCEFTPFGFEWIKSVVGFLALESNTGMVLFVSFFLIGMLYAAVSRRKAAALIALLVLGLPPIGLWLVNRSGYIYAQRQNMIVLPFIALFVAAGIVGLSELAGRLTSDRTSRKMIGLITVFSLITVMVVLQIPEAREHISYQLLWRQEWKGVAQDLQIHADQRDLIVHSWHYREPGELWERCLDFYLPDELRNSAKKLTDAAWELKKRIMEQDLAALPRTIWYVSAKSRSIDRDIYEVGKFGSLSLFRPKKNPTSLDEMVDLLGSYPLKTGTGTLEEIGSAIEVFAIFDRYERAFEIADSSSEDGSMYCLLGSVAQKKENYEIAKFARVTFAIRSNGINSSPPVLTRSMNKDISALRPFS